MSREKTISGIILDDRKYTADTKLATIVLKPVRFMVTDISKTPSMKRIASSSVRKTLVILLIVPLIFRHVFITQSTIGL